MQERFSLPDQEYLSGPEPRQLPANLLNQFEGQVLYPVVAGHGFTLLSTMEKAALAVDVAAAGDVKHDIRGSGVSQLPLDKAPQECQPVF
jgi:hypothetical protein